MVSTTDGTMASSPARPGARADLMRRTVEIHQKLWSEWPRLARHYRKALPGIVSPEQWAQTFETAAPQPAPEAPAAGESATS